MPSRPVVVYDTGIVLQATLNPDGPAERALAKVQEQTVVAIMSARLRSEYEGTLKREDLRKKYPLLQSERFVEAQLRRVDKWIERVPNPPERITYDRDPKDAPIINLIIQIQADSLVSRDRDLLDLNRDTTFTRLCPTARVVDPVEFLHEMEMRPDLQQNREEES